MVLVLQYDYKNLNRMLRTVSYKELMSFLHSGISTKILKMLSWHWSGLSVVSFLKQAINCPGLFGIGKAFDPGMG